jgi:transcriptional regulator with XRE-family HTH domain
MEVGQEIRRLREARGWSQAKLAGAAGMGVSGVSQIETGARNPSAVTLGKIAQALGGEVGDFYPKATRRPSPEAPEDQAGGERRADELMTQLPTAEERIRFIEKAVKILRFWYERGQRDRSKMGDWREERSTSYLWHGFYFNALQPAMERDGVLLHASYVVDGPVEVSEREYAACERLRDYDTKIQHLVWEMREVDEENNAHVREEGSRGVAEILEYLENIPESVPGPRGHGEG